MMEGIETELSSGDIDYYTSQDSGYHTTFTPSSFENSDVSTDFRNQSGHRSLTFSVGFLPDLKICLSPTCGPLKPHNDITKETPPRRGLKRPYPSDGKQATTLPTPTTIIAGKISSLEVNEDKENTTIYIPSESPAKSSRRYICRLKIPDRKLPYPNTPEKRNCKISCRTAKKLDFTTHSLLCKKHELEPVPENITKIQPIQPVIARPNQKIDILGLLHNESAAPAIENILRYLSNEDSQHFSNVSYLWCQIWNLYSSRGKRQEIKQYLRNIKENQENQSIDNVAKIRNGKPGHCFREIHNEINGNIQKNEHISPPHSPKSNRFKKFTKSASLDSRLQLCCVRCSQPAKVTEETTGEEWVECTNITCAYQFCRACNCNRHPGKSCFQYDLNAPSPSKRKKCQYAIGTMKSRKNLRRLL